MRIENTRLIAVALALGAAALTEAQTQGRITGTIQDDKGVVLANAFVTLNSQRPLSSGTLFNGSAKTATDGTFTIASVPPGTYQVCVQVPRSLLLDPCKWSDTPPSVTVGTQPTVQLGVIQLRAGYALSSQLIDDTGDLAKNEGKTAGASFLIGIWSNTGLFQPLRLKGKDAMTHHYELVVPYDTPLQFSVQSSFFKFSDQNGVVASQSKLQMPLQIPSGTTSPPIAFHVKGVNP